MSRRVDDLASRSRPATGWRVPTDDGRAPRLAPAELIGRGMTRAGIFEDKDPLRLPRFWTRWEWLGLAFWAALIGGAGWKAWRDHGGLPSWPDGDDDGS